MSETTTVAAPAASTSAPAARASAEAAHHTNYVRIWGLLLALLVVSVLGPMLEIRVVTLITAFGIALVKAYIVARYFMHINIERKFVLYMLGAMLAFMLVMFGGIAPDVMRHDGMRWENQAAKAETARGEAAAKAGEHGEHGGDKAAPAGGH